MNAGLDSNKIDTDQVVRLLMPRLNCSSFLEVKGYRDSLLDLVDQGVGGFVLFEGSVQECREVCSQVRRHAVHDLLLAADCEFGTAMRFEGGTPFPPMMGIASTGSPDLARAIGRAIAREMRSVGLDWNLAPVLDVTTNPDNPIVNVRAFSESAVEVAEYGAAYIDGLQSEGILSCAKHAPGHGETDVDSHLALPSVSTPLEVIDRRELLPFRKAIAAGVSSIMTGHLAVSALCEGSEPLSLSPSGIERLRKMLPWDGPLITDALDMGALHRSTGGVGASDDPVVAALMAGNDLLEIPEDPVAAVRSLIEAVESGIVSSDRVGRALDRRQWLLDERDRLRRSVSPPEKLDVLLRDNETLAIEAFDRAAVVRGSQIPDLLQTGDWYIINGPFDDLSAREVITSLEPWLDGLDAGSEEAGCRQLREGNDRKPTVFILVFSPRGGAGTIRLDGEQRGYLEEHLGMDSIVVSLGSPYLERDRAVATRVDLFSAAPGARRVLRRLFTGL